MSLAQRQHYNRKGRRAEWLAAIWLSFKGYKILARRFKTHQGEIDLIAQKGDIVAFIEVKYRRSFNEAQQAISYQSQKRIMHAANIYLTHNRSAQKWAQRFDAVYILPKFKIHHEIDAWRPY